MKPAAKLSGEALRYHRRHAKRLEDAGILTDADAEAFTLLAQLWQRCQELAPEAQADPKRNRTYLETVKAYQSLARQFGLLPLQRKRGEMHQQPEQLDEFGF